ncbi:hypothetical protein BV22DRAFT_984191, partial [Leucogyrophana mollusca]
FNYKLLHKPGSTMGKADALSRREDHSVGKEEDNKGVTMIDPSRIVAPQKNIKTVFIGQDMDLVDRIRKEEVEEKEREELKEEEGVYWKEDKVYVP